MLEKTEEKLNHNVPSPKNPMRTTLLLLCPKNVLNCVYEKRKQMKFQMILHNKHKQVFE